MPIKTITTIIDMTADPSAARSVALDLATRFEAHVTGLVPAWDPYIPAYLSSPMPMDYVVIAIDEGQKLAEQASEHFAQTAASVGVSVEVRVISTAVGTTHEVVAQSHLSDLVIVGQDSVRSSEPMRSAVIEALLFETGVPTLIVPPSAHAGINLNLALIAWDGSPTSARAVHAAVPLLQQTKRVEVAIVAGDAGNDQILGGEVATYLARHGIEVTVNTLANNGRESALVLQEHAAALHADYIVSGAYGHSRLREFIMGGVTRTLLNESKIPLLMMH